uniref:Uncharacterized protein n=1 Tax=Anguilla anguilla TaxID=7936 RepID=A0A0E9QLU0_ANGAN
MQPGVICKVKRGLKHSCSLLPLV